MDDMEDSLREIRGLSVKSSSWTENLLILAQCVFEVSTRSEVSKHNLRNPWIGLSGDSSQLICSVFSWLDDFRNWM